MSLGVGERQPGYLKILVMKVDQTWVQPVCLYAGNIGVKYFSLSYLDVISMV